MATSSGTNPHSFVCTICTNQYQIPGTGITTIANHPTCPECIKDLFEHSITNESNFPPRWGRQVLDPWNFRHILGQDFLHRFQEVEAEWQCPATERVYCCNTTTSPSSTGECGVFMGRRRSGTESYRCKRCKICMSATCLRCLETFPPLSDEDAEHMATSSRSSVRIYHHCDPSNARRLRDQAFEGLDRGRHYQDCPRCRRRVELMDGCNHITCPCGESYCYICGRAVSENSNHWDRSRGRCPRYGQPGSGTALFSDDIEGPDGTDGDDQDTDSGSDDSTDSDHMPSQHGDAVLDEDRARWQMQRVLERQARREQRRDDRTMRRAEQGRAHIQTLARQRDIAAQTSMGVGGAPNEEQARRRIDVVEQMSRDIESAREVEAIRADLAQYRIRPNVFGDLDPQTTPGAARHSPMYPSTDHDTLRRDPRRPHEGEDRSRWLIVDELDHQRGRGRILHPYPELDRRRRTSSSPGAFQRGRSRGYSRRMGESIDIGRALAEGPAQTPQHEAESRDSRHASPDRVFRVAHAGYGRDETPSDRDWDYYVERSRQFEQRRRASPRNSNETLRRIVTIVGDGYRARRRHATTSTRTRSANSESNTTRSGRNRHYDLRSDRYLHMGRRRSLDSRHERARDAENEPRTGWRGVVERLWRYSQTVADAILDSAV